MTILLVDDFPIIREGMKCILKDKTEHIYYEAASLSQARALLEEKQPGLMIIERYVANENYMKLVEELKAKGNPAKCIILTHEIDREILYLARELGVEGYILKDEPAEDIVYGIHAVHKGGSFYSPRLMEAQSTTNDPTACLTQRELEIFREVQCGCDNAAISQKFGITQSTVKKHISNILTKLQFASRIEIIRFNKGNREVG